MLNKGRLSALVLMTLYVLPSQATKATMGGFSIYLSVVFKALISPSVMDTRTRMQSMQMQTNIINTILWATQKPQKNHNPIPCTLTPNPTIAAIDDPL